MNNSGPVPSSLHLLHQVGLVLEAESIRWGAIGAVALAYHGVIRASLDADAIITLKNSQTDLDSLAEKFRVAGLSVDLRMGEEGDPIGFVLRVTDNLNNQVDLIGGLRRSDPELFDRLLSIDFDGLPLFMASAEDLLALKLFAGGPQDLADARSLIEILGEQTDLALLRRVCERFGKSVSALCEKILAEGKAP